MKAALHNYHARMQRVLDHIDRHLDDDLDLDAVSGIPAKPSMRGRRWGQVTAGVYLQAAVLGLPYVERRTADPVLARLACLPCCHRLSQLRPMTSSAVTLSRASR